METDRAFEELRAETGSPLPVRMPFGLFGLVGNCSFLIWGWDEWPPIRYIAVAATAVPAWLLAVFTSLRFMGKKGMFFGWRRPILYHRWSWWLLLWPSPDEPRWHKTLAIVVFVCTVLFYSVGVVRWGFFPAEFDLGFSLIDPSVIRDRASKDSERGVRMSLDEFVENHGQ